MHRRAVQYYRENVRLRAENNRENAAKCGHEKKKKKLNETVTFGTEYVLTEFNLRIRFSIETCNMYDF